MQGNKWVSITISAPGTTIRACGDLECTPEQLADALRSAFDGKSFVTVKFHPKDALAIEHRRTSVIGS